MKMLLNFLLNMFGFNKKEKEDENIDVSIEPNIEPEVNEMDETKENDIEESCGPEKSILKEAKIQSFLWKPASENDSNVVILVTADQLKTEDLKMRILNHKKKVMKKINIRNSGRSNKLGHFLYPRITFRLDRSAEKLKRKAPLFVQFYVKRKNGSEKKLKTIKIIDPTKRVDIHVM